MQETLKKIVDDTPGAKGAILMGFDGIAVDQYLAESAEDLDIESLAMEFSFRFIELRNAAQSLELGELSDIAIKAEYGAFLVRCLNTEYFVAVLLESAGHFGKGRWMLRSSASSLVSEL
jgi:predicted regulator of Ras-like GTPase activity (Roadblock/LC7/MglB family)